MADDTEYWMDLEGEDDVEYYDEESAINNFIYADQRGGEGVNNSSKSNLPLGLRLNPTESFIKLLQIASDSHENSRTETHPAVPEKVKAGNFTAASIKIGNWQMISEHEGDLTAKLYYAKQKLVWEMLMETKHEGELKLKLKRKIEMQWSDICGIRATMHANQPGILEIELSKPPSFFREVNPQPRKHTLWDLSSDFTRGEAPLWRRHIVSFRPGILDRHYEQLLQSNKQLFDMSRKPFPTHESPYFDDPNNLFGTNSGMSLSFSRPYASSTSSYQQQQQQFPSYQSYNPAPLALPLSPDLSSLVEFINGDQPQTLATIWDQILDHNPQYDEEYYQPAPNLGFPIENIVLLGDQYHVHSSNPQPLMGSLLDPTDVIDPSFNLLLMGSGYEFPYAQMMQNESNSAPVLYPQQQTNWNVPPQHNSDIRQTNWNVPPQQNSDSQQTNRNVPRQHNSDNNVVNYEGSSSLPPHYYSGYNPDGHGN